MTLMNDKEKKWVNGSLGTVTSLSNNSITVLFDHTDEVGEVMIASWENIRYVWDEEKKRPIATVIGSYSQIPVNLAWAVTIHKSQGLTLDDVRVDLERGAFASGQTYVALSPARTISGLSLASPIKVSDIIVDREHDKYLTGITSAMTSGDSIEMLPEVIPPSAIGSVDLNREGGIPIFTVERFSSSSAETYSKDYSQRFEISYTSFKGRQSLRSVDVNYILHSRGNDVKYLVGHCNKAKETRSFRVDRIQRLYDKLNDKYISDNIEEYLLTIT